ncbi:MAG: hypothetical protein WAW17_17030 [Rhodococcus sp. (in: high G+C Gram-positive bacteria)]|uniref:hypothetical protein n=1 Tax=Rhodococcus sp. TaxID=1831 RepID=UPI003BB0FD13
MTCGVYNCSNLAETAIDLDPGKPGGSFSYSYETPVCSAHYSELNDPETEWMVDNFDGSGPKVLIGADLAQLDEWALTRALSVNSGSMSRRSSGNVPRRMTVTLNLAKTGTREKREVSFAATREELSELVDSLQRSIGPRT